jgi:hypothetical protein
MTMSSPPRLDTPPTRTGMSDVAHDVVAAIRVGITDA